MDKTLAWYAENFAGPVIGIIVGFTIFTYIPFNELSTTNTVNLISKLSDLGFIIFGFLLTFLGLILNSKQKIIRSFNNEKIFEKIINFNIRVIIFSALLGILGLLVWMILLSQIKLSHAVIELLSSIIISFLIMLIHDLIYFLLIFFNIIKNYS